jgi:hypothetical protein
MTDLQGDLNRTVQNFVEQITDIAHRAAIEVLQSSFSDRPAEATGTAAPWVGRAREGRGRGGGIKRTEAALAALSRRFVTFVQGNPGLRIEQINKELGTATKELALPIRRLVSEGVIRAKGHKRATTYAAAEIVPSHRL